jgi:photosystem II stability/assembly factor-like uncharacterized protein
MIVRISIFLVALVVFSCNKDKNQNGNDPYVPRDSVSLTLDEYQFPGTDVRALEVLNESTVWFAGSNGKWGYTEDNGETWHTNNIVYRSVKPDFRSIQLNGNGDVFLVSTESPAAVFRSTDKGINWEIVYEDTLDGSFFNAIEFWDNDKGLLMGDPISNCFHIAITNDGGNSWEKRKCNRIPNAQTDEYPFAASNTNIALFGKYAWFGTGGTSASRVYRSSDYGNTWDVFNTPIVSGGNMTGIYSIAFYDEKNGVVAGGDWENISHNNSNIAITEDGGETWSLVSSGANDGYISCIQYIPETQGKELFKVSGRVVDGPSSMGYSNDNGNTWQSFSNSNFISIQFATKNFAWVSGAGKIARLTLN